MKIRKEASAPYFGYAYRKPLDSYIGKFEQQMCGRRLAQRTPKDFSKSLWFFFSRFPSITHPQDVTVCDTEDYKRLLLEEGYAWTTVRTKCCHLKTFFSFVINELDVLMSNPVITMSYLPTGPLADYVPEPNDRQAQVEFAHTQ